VYRTSSQKRTQERLLVALRILSACVCLAPIGIAAPLRGIWTLMATQPGKPDYHHVLMSTWQDPLPWRLWTTCALFLVLAVVMARRAAALVQSPAVRLLGCLVCITPPILLALHHALPRRTFTSVQGYWTDFAGPHEYVPVLLGAAAVLFLCGRTPPVAALAPLTRRASQSSGVPDGHLLH
jgi:hypothetical protein